MKSNRGQNVSFRCFVVTFCHFVASSRRLGPQFSTFAVSSYHFVASSHRSAVVVSLFRFVTRLAVSSLRCFVSSFCFAYLTALQPVAKILRHSEEKRPFLLQIAAGHRSVRHNTDLPPPFHSKMFLLVLSMQSSIAFSFDKGWREITSTRSWTDHLSQNTAQCLKIFCNWL